MAIEPISNMEIIDLKKFEINEPNVDEAVAEDVISFSSGKQNSVMNLKDCKIVFGDFAKAIKNFKNIYNLRVKILIITKKITLELVLILPCFVVLKMSL